MKADEFEKAKASELLGELEGMSADRTPGPNELKDWNMRAGTLLVFAACRRIAEGEDLR